MSACYAKFSTRPLPPECNGEECEICAPKYGDRWWFYRMPATVFRLRPIIHRRPYRASWLP